MTDRRSTLERLYGLERDRLRALNDTADAPGEYLRPVFGNGDPESRVMVIGEAPGREETEAGIPFVGKAGRQLDAMFLAAGIDRAGLFVTNSVKYRPFSVSSGGKRNRTPMKREVLEGAVLLKEEILLIKPGWIVTLGNTPLSAVQMIFGMDNRKIGDVHGQILSIRTSQSGLRLYPMYHPASAIYDRSLSDTLKTDMINFGSLLHPYRAPEECSKQI